MKLLFISQYFPPEIEPSAGRISEIAQYLVGMGHEVTVITGFPNYPNGVIPPEYRGKLMQTENLNGVRVLRTFILPASTSSIGRRLANQGSFCLSSAIRNVWAGRSDVVMITSPPLEATLSAVYIAWTRRCPLLLEVRDAWPEDAILNKTITNPLIIRLTRGLEKFAYTRANRIVCIARDLKTYVVRRGVDENKLRVIVNGTNVELFRPGVRNSLPDDVEAVFDGCFSILYAGTHGLQHHLESVLETALLLKDQKKIRIIFVGDGKEKAKLVETAEAWRLENVYFLPSQPRGMLPGMLCKSDACLAHTGKLDKHIGAFPAKVFDYMACGKPIILGVDGEVVEHVHNSGLGSVSLPIAANPYLLGVYVNE